MTKTNKVYLIMWVIAVAAFNAIFFIVGHQLQSYYWPGYIACVVAFVGNLACGFIAFSRGTLKETTYHIPLIRDSYLGLILTLCAAIYFRFNKIVPDWVAIVVYILILALTAIRVVGSKATADAISSVDKQIVDKTFSMKSLTSSSEILLTQADNPEIKSELKKVYEALRYSDPVSNERLNAIEIKIGDMLQSLSNAVNDGNVDIIKAMASDIIKATQERNAMAKLLK